MQRIRRLMRPWIALVSAISLSLPLAGCGSSQETVSVSGTVTFDDVPLKKGWISFQGMGGENTVSRSTEIVKGKYSFSLEDGLIAGKYQVVISAVRKTNRPIKRFETLKGEKGGKVVTEQYIPKRYNDHTELKRTLVAGGNSGGQFNFKLVR